ncbi:MAG: hypothetical protein ACLFTY_01970 [Candidatus Aenigmatarchaeota archaeon]
MNFKEILQKIRSQDTEVDNFEEEIEELKEIWTGSNLLELQNRIDNLEAEIERTRSQRRNERLRSSGEDSGSMLPKDFKTGTSGKRKGESRTSSQGEAKERKTETRSRFRDVKRGFEEIGTQDQGSSQDRPFRGGGKISKEMEAWLSKNLNRGFKPDELKRSLKGNGMDPSVVDEYLKNQ